jgi:hypothetical protein
VDHVVAAEQQHDRERQVGQHGQLRSQLGPLGDALDVGLAQQARLRFEAFLHQRHPAERLDDADACRHLLDDRGEVALLVLHPPGQHLVLVVELVAEVDERPHADHDRDRQLGVELRHQHEHDRKRHDRLQEPDQPEAHKPAHGCDVRDRPRQQLARLPVVVK